jgi:hypothetical protein
MEEVDSLNKSPFNGSLETGMRAVMALHASFPIEFDIQRLTALDYLILRTSLLDGPDDLHPSTPITTPVTQVRRKAVYDALDLMMSRELVERTITDQGIYFRAGEYSSFFVEALSTKYAQRLRHRAIWVANYFKGYSEAQFNSLMAELLGDWVAEFQDEAPRVE